MRGERGDTVVDVASDVVSLPDAPPPEEVVDHIPHGVDWRYEPDWDGLRVTARLGPGVARLVSGRRRNYDPFFPEVVGSLSELDVRDTIVEGSLIVADANGLTFASVRRRLHPSSSRVEWLARSSPATLALTDVVMDRGDVIGYGEENVVQQKLRKLGKTVGFCPDLVMSHLVAEYKYSIVWHLRRQFALARDRRASHRSARRPAWWRQPAGERSALRPDR